ncbi:MAG: GNAT family N-acetyltransferase [Gemmatimonadota bacterium]
MQRVERWSETPVAQRDAWRQSFIASAAALRGDRAAAQAPSAKYTELILRLASARPHELLMARDGDVTGRALVSAATGRAAAAVGLVELAVGEAGANAARAIVDAATEWAEQAGLDELIAPVDVNTWFSYRFLLPPAPGPVPPAPFAWEPAQPDDYPRVFAALGFEELERYQTLGGDLTQAEGEDAATVLAATEMAFKKAAQAGFTFHRLETPDALAPLLDELHALCMDAFRDNLLFEPIPLELFRALYAESSGGRDATLTHWVRDAIGRLAGFVLAFVDGDTAVVKTIAVTPELRGKRISSALVHLVLKTSVARGLRKAVSALVRRGNTSEHLSSPYLKLGVTPWKREYVLMRRAAAAR